MCRRYTNITRVILTRVIFNPGQNGASVDAAIVAYIYIDDRWSSLAKHVDAYKELYLMNTVTLRKSDLCRAMKSGPEVKQLLDDERSGNISKINRVKDFNDFKREGIRKRNQCRITENSDDLISERRCAGQKVMCSGCSGFF